MVVRLGVVKVTGVFGVPLLLVAGLLGQSEPIPLSEEDAISFAARNDDRWLAGSAQRALESGLYEIASEMANDILASGRSIDSTIRAQLALTRIDAYLGWGKVEKAVRLLDNLESHGVDENSIALRKAVLAFAEESTQDATQAITSIDSSRLERGERVWLAFLRGWLDAASGDFESARIEFETARSGAEDVSSELYSRIAFLTFVHELENSEDSISIEELRQSYEAFRGSEDGFRYAQLLAVAADKDGDREGAIGILNTALEELPVEYRSIGDQMRLLQVVIAGLDSDAGRESARSLVVDGSDRGLQRVALQQMATNGLSSSEGQNQHFLDTLDTMLDKDPPHALAPEALYYRAVSKYYSAIREESSDSFISVDDDGERLLRDYPDSEYNRGALALLAASAWQRNRFRTAASYLTQFRSEYASPDEESRLNVLIADCYFRAGEGANNPGDFSDAADAYQLALSGNLVRDESSQVFFQLVLSHLNAGEIDDAKRALDDPGLTRRSTIVKIWQAEWMLIKRMRQLGESMEAYERINSFVGLEDLNLSLQLRMLWFGSKLSFESGLYAETQVWFDRLMTVLEEIGPSELIERVESDAKLTLAESLLRQGTVDEGLAILSSVRNEFPGSESAERSYLVEARHLSDQDLVVESSQLLNELVENSPESRFAPLALYEIALNAEKRGQGEYLSQAIEHLDRIALDYPESDLVYYARLKQGNLARKLNEFEAAELVYESLENTYRDRDDRYWAQISLADTLIARASEDPSKFEAGISRLEYLVDLPTAPVPLRVEAGYKIGIAWENQGELAKAKAAFWNLYNLFVEDESRMQRLEKQGRYWLSRSLFELAEIFQSEANLDMAIEFYRKIEELGLLGSELARARIDQLRGRGPIATAQ